MIKFIKRIIPACIENYLHLVVLDSHALKSYSQEGEDMILRRFFENQSSGFYVDVGAHHPKRFSNTYFFYKLGWMGINIDAMPGSMDLFNKFRPRDINVESPISTMEGEITYHMFNEPALNGFDTSLSEKRHRIDNQYELINKVDMRARSLKSILDEFLPEGVLIDFISVDVEGFDFDVLRSNDWKKYRPKIVLVEILETPLSNFNSNEIVKFLFDKGYQLYAKSMNTAIFKSLCEFE